MSAQDSSRSVEIHTEYIIEQLVGQQNSVDKLILKVPTGPRRNQLCDANILLMAAIECLRSTHEH